MPYADPDKQRLAVKLIMRNRRAKERLQRNKQVQPIIDTYRREIGCPNCKRLQRLIQDAFKTP